MAYMEQKTTPDKVRHIEGRRWFERTCGNTYHSTTLYLRDGSSIKVPYAYGYGEQFLQTAYTLMGAPYGGTLDLREKYGITYSVTDVAHKRDL